MIYAFLRLSTVEDLFDVIALSKRGAVVGFEPIEGSIFGPSTPPQFETVPVLKEGEGYSVVMTTSTRLRMAPGDLETFLARYLDDARPFDRLVIEECEDLEAIRSVWRILNLSAGRALSKLSIIDLVQVLADTYGGRIEPQIAYGAPGWAEAVKAGKTWVTLWHRPSEAEIEDMIACGVRGIINGEEAEVRRTWYVGTSGPYLMPHRGFIEYDEDRSPEAAYDASGEPSGLGITWDRIRDRYRLTGLQIAPTATDADRRLIGWAARTYASDRTRKGRGAVPQDHPVWPVLTLPRDGAAAELLRTWGEWVRVDLDQGAA